MDRSNLVTAVGHARSFLAHPHPLMAHGATHESVVLGWQWEHNELAEKQFVYKFGSLYFLMS